MKLREVLTVSELKLLLNYDSVTGLFRWLPRTPSMFEANHNTAEQNCNTWNSRFSGKIAGSTPTNWYTTIVIYGRKYRAHVLAWLYMTSNWPVRGIDHWDLNKSNNSWRNLRSATRFQNQANRSKNVRNATGYKGVYYNIKLNKFYAQIMVKGKRICLGYHSTAEGAHALYVKATQLYNGEFARWA